MASRIHRREATLAALDGLGCKPVTATFDRTSASYAIGHSDGSGYFSPTFGSEGAALDWAGSHLGRIERHVGRGEPLEPVAFIAHVVSAASAVACGDARTFAEALSPRMGEIREDAETIGDRDLDALIDDIEDGRLTPSDAMSALTDVLGVDFMSAPTP